MFVSVNHHESQFLGVYQSLQKEFGAYISTHIQLNAKIKLMKKARFTNIYILQNSSDVKDYGICSLIQEATKHSRVLALDSAFGHSTNVQPTTPMATLQGTIYTPSSKCTNDMFKNNVIKDGIL